MSENFEHLHSIKQYTEVNRSLLYNRNVTQHVAEIEHLGLKTFEVIKLEDKSIVDILIKSKFSKWDEQWAKVLEQNDLHVNQLAVRYNLLKLENLLKEAVDKDNSFDIESLYEDKPFLKENPKRNLQKELDDLVFPSKPILDQIPNKPHQDQFEEKFTLMDNFIKSRKQKKEEFQEFMYNNAITQWENSVKLIEIKNEISLDEYNNKINLINAQKEELSSKYTQFENQWISEKKTFFTEQDSSNESITDLKNAYTNKETTAVVKYCQYVLNKSDYIKTFPRSFEIEFKGEEGFLVVNYVLPCPEDLPKIAEIKFIASKKEVKEVLLSETQQVKNYEGTIYKIVLRTIYELFQADKIDAIKIVALNGWVNAINKGTGKRVNSCIVSIQVSKEEFNIIDLSNVDPKICFKNLKGISASKLNLITAIKPVIQINRNDSRFVSSYDVTDSIDESSNLAIMSWEDFEHLIREIFEKEFSYNGGEVKVTQASRDGGVDAIAFDPDPIRGGKIIIQAKRYTNTVGVSAVRDLYGTVLNEGATKGILVTTTDYGPDAYEFVKNKPLTLMNGANLLYLLERHGYKAKIDIAEARFLMSKNNRA